MVTKSNFRMDRRAREFIDSLLSDKRKPAEENTSLLGNIGGVANQFVHGWVVDTEDKNRPVAISIFSGNNLVGFGSADIYRQDLEHAGYGDGRHGFKIRLDARCFKKHPAELTIRESDTGVRVSGNQFSVSSTPDYAAEFVGVTDRRIIAQITSGADAFGEPGIEILADQKQRLPCTIVNTCGNKAIVEAVMDESGFDGALHSFEVIVNDASCLGAVHLEVLHPIATPEDILKDSIGRAGYPFAAKTAIHRYQSLVRRIEDCNDGSDENLLNLIVAHRQMEMGPQKRKSWPRLRLPAVSNPEVSILIAASNGFASTYHSIASLILSQNQASFEVVLIDDASTDETVGIEDVMENIRVIRNDVSEGLAACLNSASDYAHGRYVCLLDSQSEVASGWIDAALNTFSIYERVGCVGAKIIDCNGRLMQAGGTLSDDGSYEKYGESDNASHPRYNHTRDAECLTTAALFVDKKVWDDAGGLNNDFQTAAYLGADLTRKLRASGYKTLYCPASAVIDVAASDDSEDTVSETPQDSDRQILLKQWDLNTSFNAPDHDATAHDATEIVSSESETTAASFRVLVVDANTPRLNNDAGSYAAIQEMKLLMETGAQLVFLPLNFAHMGKHTERLQSLGIECLHYPFYTTIEQVMTLRGAEFDAVYITRYETVHAVIDAVKSHSEAKVIFNNADLHFMRELRESLQADGVELSGPLATREKELEAIGVVDLTLCYTETERAIVASHLFSEDKIKRCPWVVSPVATVPPLENRSGIAFLGGFSHKPNVEAVYYFCKEVMPRLIERDPQIVLNIYGSGMPDELLELASDNVRMVGFVENLEDVFSTSRVFVSPLLTGAGLNGKMIDCMAHGLPSVISPLTADGTGLVHGQSALIAESVEDWVDGVCELNSNDELWNTFSDRSIDIARTLFSSESGIKRMSEIVSSIGIVTDNGGAKVFS